MAANVQPIFGKIPLGAAAQISAANANRDGTGTIADVAAPTNADGCYIERVEIEAAGTVANGVVRLFLNNGTTNFLFEEILVTATTPSTTVAAFSASSARISSARPLFLPTGWKLRASTNNAETFNVFAIGAQFS
jgi:hypothetical protein